jgi:glycerol kinase
MIENELLMQFRRILTDLLSAHRQGNNSSGRPYAAGLGVGLYKNADELCSNWSVNKTWTPQMEDRKRESMYQSWKKAVSRTFDWSDE